MIEMEERDRKRMLRDTRRMTRTLFKRLKEWSQYTSGGTEAREEVSISNAILRCLDFERSLREHRRGPKDAGVRQMENIEREVDTVLMNTTRS